MKKILNSVLAAFLSLALGVIISSFPHSASAENFVDAKSANKAVRSMVMKMRYCHVIADGRPTYKLTFHSNGSVTIDACEARGPYDTPYESAGAYESGPYGGGSCESATAYDGSRSPRKGTWTVRDGRLLVTLGQRSERALVLTRKSVSRHECY